MSSSELKSIAEVATMGESLIALARRCELVVHDEHCSALFGKVRDCGYELKRLAEGELARRKRFADGGASAVPQAASAAVHASIRDRKVLIVEDDPDTIAYLQAWFEDLGLTTDIASDGDQALSKARGARPDLITLDVSIPVKSGVKVFRTLKGDEALRSIPVIIITGIGEPMQRFLEGRARVPAPEGFLGKPMDMNQLALIVRRVLSTQPARPRAGL